MTRGGIHEIKVQATKRKDSRVSVTVKLIGFEAQRLVALDLDPNLQARIARSIRYKIVDIFKPTDYDL